jgi:DNA-binding IscR family transcriptional regulator
LVCAGLDCDSIDYSWLPYIPSFVEAVTMKRIPIDVRILNFLATQPEPVTINQIDDEIDCYPNIIASYLRGLTDKGLVVAIATGKVKRYFLAK